MTDVCPNCHAGALRKRPVTYAAWHTLSGEGAVQFVVVPHIAAWLCDVCGIKLFDEEALAWLIPLLGPPAEMDENLGASAARQAAEASRDALDGNLDRGRVQ